jgi:hypothetical protein
MVHRFALVAGAVTAAGILLLALGVGGLFAETRRQPDGPPTATGTDGPASVDVETVYVRPAPTGTGEEPPRRVLVVDETDGDREHDDDDDHDDDGREEHAQPEQRGHDDDDDHEEHDDGGDD